MHAPSLTLSSLDVARLEKLLASLPADAVPDREGLETELLRADVVAPAAMPPDVVSMNSQVRFRIPESGKTFTLRLVYPRDVDPAGGTVSILAPVGSALLGLREGDEIAWPRPGGGQMRVCLESVLYQPERTGDHHL